MLTHPLVRGINIDDVQTVRVHRQLIDSKPNLKRLMRRWYQELVPSVEATQHLDGKMVEIGCGAGFLDEVIPQVIKTDVMVNPYADQIVDAMSLPYANESLRALFLTGVFHHIPDAAQFLSEAERTLQVGGRLSLIEAHNSGFAKWVTNHMPHYEYFDDRADWMTSKDRERMSGANLSTAWIIFFRDQELFRRRFPKLRLHSFNYHTFLSFYLSGGMSYRSFVPNFCWPIVEGMETICQPFMKQIGVSITLHIEKVA